MANECGADFSASPQTCSDACKASFAAFNAATSTCTGAEFAIALQQAATDGALTPAQLATIGGVSLLPCSSCDLSGVLRDLTLSCAADLNANPRTCSSACEDATSAVKLCSDGDLALLSPAQRPQLDALLALPCTACSLTSVFAVVVSLFVAYSSSKFQ